ncbi:uncharacterized protein LOC121866348 isoform X2 [Homarus americanus]|uniref:uncharacterized protein LOC121866348 isoform X2 n=1 Tax=Homarus americanus TaxID=6706 RepID=UPI001C457268|nr:uncharacterized protein LOC121866348 isoform X2 [Homarus americanus]
MDSLTCGLCKLTFHELEEFIEHKRSHGHQNLPRNASSQQGTETELGCEISYKTQMPISCPSTSQFGATATTSTLSVSTPSLSLAPNSCDTSSSVSLSNPSVNSTAPALFSMYLASSSQIRSSVIDTMESNCSFAEALERPKSVPDTGSTNTKVPDTFRSDIGSTSFLAPSKYCPLVSTPGTNGTKLIESIFDRKMSIPANGSLQSYNSPVSTVSILSPCSLSQVSSNDANKQLEQSKPSLSLDDVQQNMSEDEVKDVILIELSETPEKSCELVAKVNVPPCVLSAPTTGRSAIEEVLMDPQCEREKKTLSKLQSNQREVTCMISELNRQDYTATQDCLPNYCTDSSIAVPSDLSVIIDGVREQPVEASVSDHCVRQKVEDGVTGGKIGAKSYSSDNYGCVYATANPMSCTNTTANMDNLIYENSDHCTSLGNIVTTNVNITNDFSAEKVYFSQGSSIITTTTCMYINSDSKFENKPAESNYDKSVSDISRIVSLENEASVVSLREVISGSSDCYGTGATTSSNNTIARLSDEFSLRTNDDTASGISAMTPAATSCENFNAGNGSVTSETNNKIDTEFGGRTAVKIVPQIVSEANHETGTLCNIGNSEVVGKSINLAGNDGNTTKTSDIVASESSNRNSGNSATWTDPRNQTEAAVVVSDESGCTSHAEDSSPEVGVHTVPQSCGETTILNGEEINFVDSSELGPGSTDVADLAYASTPGLYTLLLNADNTFTLVAGGYQGTSASQGSQVFVCRQCNKFTLSQVEILNHISMCHPEDLDNVNQSVWKFCALPSSYSENSDILNDADPIFRHGITLNTEMTSRGSGNCLAVEGNGSLQMSPEDSSARLTTNKRTVKRKLGRPRKEDMISNPEKNMELTKEKNFKFENNKFMCIDCNKTFIKQRQFDKHKCCMWQFSLEQLSHTDMESFAIPLLSQGKVQEAFASGDSHKDTNFKLHQDIVPEEDLGEEWKGSKYYKAKTKPKPSGGERRKRGRPPKVDSLGYGTRSKEDHSEQVPQPEGQAADDKECRYKGEVKPLQGPKSIPNTDTTPSLLSGVNADLTVLPRTSSETPYLHAIPTLPLFSNPRQQERLHKWIAQIDLSFVDSIIDKVCHDKGAPNKRGMAMYVCRECKVLFRTLLLCRRHCAKHMSKKAFTCPDCDFATTNVSALYSHYRNHTQNLYACDKCDFRARIKAHYRDHLETHNPSRHICQLCQKPYSTSNSLKSHIYLSHRNEEGMNYKRCLRKKKQEQNKQGLIYQCPVCSKLFYEKLLANKHIATHSSNVSKAVVKCEVCDTQPLHHGTLRRHLLKHKVIYICCICYKPQLTVSCLRSHLKEGLCNSHQGDTFKLSLLCSYTSPETFPSLISNKRLGLGPLLQDLTKHLTDHQMPDTKLSSNLIRQIQEAGYKQIYVLLQDEHKGALSKISNSQSPSKVMKIVINTRLTTVNEQVTMDEKRYVIIHEENEGQQPMKFDSFLAHVS